MNYGRLGLLRKRQAKDCVKSVGAREDLVPMIAQHDRANVHGHKELYGIISKTRGAGIDGRIQKFAPN